MRSVRIDMVDQSEMKNDFDMGPRTIRFDLETLEGRAERKMAWGIVRRDEFPSLEGNEFTTENAATIHPKPYFYLDQRDDPSRFELIFLVRSLFGWLLLDHKPTTSLCHLIVVWFGNEL